MVRVVARFVLDRAEVSLARAVRLVVIAAPACAPGWWAVTSLHVRADVNVQAASVSSGAASHVVQAVHVAAPFQLEKVPGV